jgi:hypothetical protein
LNYLTEIQELLQESIKQADRYLSDEGKSYSWEEVKQELQEKHGLSS